ncbi:restriction endonuclease [Burkholderia ubonensis]|uniref:restriction endonuclease n=1 Tax=Burkholderia ubonensis TaxID=101571 RepID=UPI0007561F4B|nr:restriction endonuclease [Burkholderia ubonensis]AOI70056.1 restriction endonuclease [Burkholderia ubonensis]KUZ14049.1 restriction endonuclease [Burkholderia ubonensis]KUZ23629.1 restriction endonuclease [Burkholderia ubonensis]KUZ35942.1 restriction endonuclease [Burkholderia ubonensis]KUZ47172.1 restriction endonuclease [Burkholderia ubonensis]
MTDIRADITFHYPPELFNLLVDVIPLLNRSKQDLLVFFRGAGVPGSMTSDIATRLRAAPKEVNKYEIVRTVLERLNAKSEASLRERREVLRRVVDFASFDSCWPDDQLKAKGLVASIREVVNQKDAFTRMNNAREEERHARLVESLRSSSERRERMSRIENAKQGLYALFGTLATVQERGKMLETALNNLFQAYGVLIHKAFHLVGDAGEGIVEQIDGVIELGGALYFVEMKWYRNPVGKPEISEHLVRLMSRAEVRGIFISASDYTEPAIHTVREFLQHKVLILSTLQEIVRLLERQDDLAEFFAKKVQAAQIHKNPYFCPYSDQKRGTL